MIFALKCIEQKTKDSLLYRKVYREVKESNLQYLIAIGKNVYIEKLDDIVSDYNKVFLNTIKVKPNDITFLIISSILLE